MQCDPLDAQLVGYLVNPVNPVGRHCCLARAIHVVDPIFTTQLSARPAYEGGLEAFWVPGHPCKASRDLGSHGHLAGEGRGLSPSWLR